jgi:hypothetical protein
MPRFQLLVNWIKNGALVVTSACNEDIPVGTMLTVLWSHKARHGNDNFKTLPLGEPESVCLTIESVEAFEKPITEAPRGRPPLRQRYGCRPEATR